MIKTLYSTLAVALLFASSAHAATQNPDNSQVNQRDRVEGAKTADHQMKSSASATEITRLIRRELTKDSSLSTNAQNIKIITNDSSVTLRGPVMSAEEKTKIEQVAHQVATNHTIQNQLEIKKQ